MIKTEPTAFTKPLYCHEVLMLSKTMIFPKILYEDQHLIVISKPVGLLSQADHSQQSNLVDLLRHYWKRHYVGLVHRLDRETSGLMIVAKRSKAARRLSEALQTGTLKRIYLGWVWGSLKTTQTWSHRLLKNKETNQVHILSGSSSPFEKKASLHATPQRWTQMDQLPITLVSFELCTGRSHQIRVQCTHEGYPILGDLKYTTRTKQPRPFFQRLALHSFYLKFPHPMSHDEISFQEELPQELQLK